MPFLLLCPRFSPAAFVPLSSSGFPKFLLFKFVAVTLSSFYLLLSFVSPWRQASPGPTDPTGYKVNVLSRYDSVSPQVIRSPFNLHRPPVRMTQPGFLASGRRPCFWSHPFSRRPRFRSPQPPQLSHFGAGTSAFWLLNTRRSVFSVCRCCPSLPQCL